MVRCGFAFSLSSSEMNFPLTGATWGLPALACSTGKVYTSVSCHSSCKTDLIAHFEHVCLCFLRVLMRDLPFPLSYKGANMQPWVLWHRFLACFQIALDVFMHIAQLHFAVW